MPSGYWYVHTKELNSNVETYFLKSNTKTVPSEAEAPTLSPRLFQHTSKIPPVPLYE